MKNKTSRRLFIRNSTLATLGISLFSPTIFANTLINDTSLSVNLDKSTDLRVSSLFGKHVTVKGKIFDSKGVTPISNAIIEVWHLSPNSKNKKYNTKIETNELGEYSFITDFPNKEKGKSPRIYFKVSNGTKEYATELVLTDFGADITGEHWEKNKQLGKKLYPIKEGSKNSSKITFNISI